MSPRHDPSRVIEAPWPDAPRYAPAVPLPDMAYVPGTPRAGRADVAALVREHSTGTDDDFFLFGIDLYHYGYHWEAHEAWETLWSALARHSTEAKFYRGLILNAAAQLKRREGRMRGVITLSRGSYAALREVVSHADAGVFLQLDLARTMEAMERHYGGLWSHPSGGGLQGLPPRLMLAR